MKRALALLALALPALGDGFYDRKETAELADALAALNLVENDLGFQKKPLVDEVWVDEYRAVLPIVDRLLDHPLETPGVCQDMARKAMEAHGKSDITGLLTAAREALAILPCETKDDPERTAVDLSGLPEPLRAPVQELIHAFARTRAESRSALSSLDERERAAILSGNAGADVLLGLWAEVDRGRLFRAADFLARAACKFRRDVSGLPIELRVPVTLETPAGRVLLGGGGDDVYSEGVDLLVDVGGNDTYACPVGASGPRRPASLLIDLSGNDRYLPPAGNAGTQGTGILGVGLLLDASGDDLYRAGGTSQGAGLFGIGILMDEGGDDRYQADVQAQGAGEYGAGFLLDRAGDDLYEASQMAQAFSSVQGYGLLSDLKGNDLYRAGGKTPHAPLIPSRYRCLSQGFSIGERYKAGGGVALLADGGGNDVYQGDVYAQGTSYWLSLGILYDVAGHDEYSATIYAQGAGVHLSVGCLMDMEGEDAYVCLHGVGQGAGHDFSVGVLYDREGSDRYLAGGFAQGSADENSVALLLDRGGGDQYSAWREDSQGHGSGARGTISVGLMLDLGGKENRIALKEGCGEAADLKDTRGVLRADVEPPKPPGKAPPPADETVKEVPGDDVERLFALAARWEVGSQRAEVMGARKRLIELGEKALPVLVPGKLHAERIYDMRALKTVCQGIGAPAAKALMAQLESKDRYVRRSAVEILGFMGAKEAEGGILKRLEDPEAAVRQKAMGTLAGLRSKAAVPFLAKVLREDADEGARILAATCLGVIGAPEALDALADALRKERVSVRHPAAWAISKAGPEGIERARALLKGADHCVRLHALEILGWAKAEAARGEILPLLKDPDWTVRLYAVRALSAMKDEAVKAFFAEMAKGEANAYVKSALAEGLGGENPPSP